MYRKQLNEMSPKLSYASQREQQKTSAYVQGTMDDNMIDNET